MKKNDILKKIGIGFLIFILLTWIIPAGSFANGEYTKVGLEPYGFFNLFKLPISTMSNYFVFGLYVLVIAGFYGILAKTGAYGELISTIYANYKNKPSKFMYLTVVLFALLTSITGLQYVVIILVPFFIHVMAKLGYNKYSQFWATIGAILVGNVGSIYGFNVSGYLNYYFNLDINNNIVAKIALLILLVLLVIFYITKNDNPLVKKQEKKKVVDKKETIKKVATKKAVKKTTTKKTTKKPAKTKAAMMDVDTIVVSNKKSMVPMILLVSFTVIFLLVAGYNWSYGLEVKWFEELYTKIAEVTTKDNFAWLQSLIGTIAPLGYWGIEESIIVLLISSGLLAWVYNISIKDACTAFVDNAKRYLNVAIIVTIANIIIYSVLSTSTGNNIYYTVSNSIFGLADTFHVLVIGLFSLVSGLFLNDFTYFVGYMASPLSAIYTDSNVYSTMAIIMQAMHGITMLVVPTSVLLVGGLSLLDINFKEYIKYAWKLIIQMLVATVIVVLTMIMFM